MAKSAGIKSPKKAGRTTRLQYGALPYRTTKLKELEILLITSRETKRWIIPKGWPIKGLKPCDSAAQEAYEEAGVRGSVDRRPIGKYTYDKRLNQSAKLVPCEVHVYPLRVRRQEKTWPEIDQRETRWFPANEAIAIVDDFDMISVMKVLIAKIIDKSRKK